MTRPNQSNTIISRQLGLISLLFIGIALFLAAYTNVRTDEAYTLQTTSQDVIYGFHQAINYEGQPPAYFVLQTLWRDINDSFFFARLFSILMILLSIPVVDQLAKRFVPEIPSWWIVGIFLFNPYTIYHATDVRCYSLVILISSLLLLTYWEGFLKDRPNRYAQVGHAMLAGLAVITHYYTGFLLASFGVTLLLTQRWRSMFQYGLAMVVPALCLAALIPHLPDQLSSHEQLSDGAFPIIDSLRWLLNTLEDFILGANWLTLPRMGRWAFRLSWMGLLVAVFIKYRRTLIRQFISPESLNLWLVIGIQLAIYVAIYIFMGVGYVKTLRYLAPVFIPLLLGFCVLLASLPKPEMGILGLIAIYLFGAFTSFSSLVKEADYKGVANYLEQIEESGQPILIYRNAFALALSHHYKGVNELKPVPYPVDFSVPWEFDHSLLKEESEVGAVIDQLEGNPDSFWVVTYNQGEIGGFDSKQAILESYLKKYFEVESSQSFLDHFQVRFVRKREEVSP